MRDAPVEMGIPLAATLSATHITEVGADAAWLEDLGYRGLWVGEGRLRRDAVTQLTLAAAATRRAYLSSGIVPFRTRNVALLATTWKTLYQLAPDRVRLGLGAWWEPIASRTGLPTARPLTAMREVVTVLRALLAGREATLAGDYVQVDRIRFDAVEDEAGARYPVPLYLAAVGRRMLALAAEIADGALLDFFLPPSYTREATAVLDETPRGAGLSERPDRPQLVACCVDDRDPDQALAEMRAVLTRYLAQQRHVALHCGADPDLVATLRRRYTWPATSAELREAAGLVPMALVRRVTAVGRRAEVIETLESYRDAGCSEIVVTAFGSDRRATFREISRGLARRLS